jgi:hypothetical protein
MYKRLGVLTLMLAAAASILPQPALAQGGYYGPQNGYYQSDREWDRGGEGQWGDRNWQGRGWRDGDRRDRRAEEWREREWRRREWREHEWRERQRSNNGYYRNYNPGSHFYFGFGR